MNNNNPYSLPLLQDGRQLLHLADDRLIRRFKIKNKGKLRDVNDPVPELKTILKAWNGPLTDYYVRQLQLNGVSHVAHAYLPNRSIQTNAQAHLYSPIIQFDFKGFYDSCKFDYFRESLRDLDPTLDDQNEYVIKRLLIDPNTGGVTQGLPVSGALAGLSLIPFWVELAKSLPDNIRFTQYSDDLTFSYTGQTPPGFTVPALTQKIYEVLKKTDLSFKLNADKTRTQKEQYRKVTGIRINHHNQTTPSRDDYRFLRHALYILSKSDDLDKELAEWGFASKSAFVGKVSYMRSIDSTGKIDRLIMKYRTACRKHDIFTTWIDQAYKRSAFA
ncbi:reverse transcriptase domain-containing protein [Evansella clarkii]|uniref:reverse transcriptase domain-containing protein n=1 Tax=Evansella clarkii TaxID=79879 RepID=UPI000995F2BE|nr:reverse transcriptase domain-containing protein [Evansella clarkii]